ncbi:MAG: cobalamin biosynthesis protein CobD [Oligoflexia bacterium]|nr:cobalamin biosynthesis protein CobD [Oligoflexia bacterium]
MKIEYLILFALLLDLIFGDPRWFPHPVKIMGILALKLENHFIKINSRSRSRSLFIKGIFSALIIYISSILAVIFIRKFAYYIHPLCADLVTVFILYTTIALKDLIKHSQDVLSALTANDLLLAREKLQLFVGRDTNNLDQKEIIRATVESVAENFVDGVLSPLFFAFLFGAEGAIFYKAINTLDSMWGYKNERYLHFGHFAARVDDVANFIPARLSIPIIALAALIFKLDAKSAITIALRDGHKHPGPNSGRPEAAVAGALGVRLGGINFYRGRKSIKPFLGDSRENLKLKHIKIVNTLVAMSTLIFVLIYFLICTLILK